MSDSINLNFLESLSYGWHKNVSDIKPIRMLKALKSAVQGFFGRFKVELSDKENLKMVKDLPNAWFSTKINKVLNQRKVTQVPGENLIKEPKNPTKPEHILSNPKILSQLSESDLKTALECIKTLNEFEAHDKIDNAITKLKNSDSICSFIKKNPSLIDSFFQKFVVYSRADYQRAVDLMPLVNKMMELGFSPSNSQDEAVVKGLIYQCKDSGNVISESDADEKSLKVARLDNLRGIDSHAERLTVLHEALEAAKDNVERTKELHKSALTFTGLKLIDFRSASDSDKLETLTLFKVMKDGGVPFSDSMKEHFEYLQVGYLEALFETYEVLTEQQLNYYEKALSKLFKIIPERSYNFNRVLCRFLQNTSDFNLEQHSDLVSQLTILKKAGWNFENGSFSLAPVNENNPLSLIFKKFCLMLSNGFNDLAIGLLDTGIWLTDDQKKTVKSYLKDNKITMPSDIKTAFDGLSGPREVLKLP